MYNKPLSSTKIRDLENNLLDVVVKASQMLKSSSLGILYRKPILDEDCPEVSDVDLILLYENPDECPERITFDGSGGRIFVDMLWIPISQILDSSKAASYKILPHLLLESEIFWIQSNLIKILIDKIKSNIYHREIWKKRIHDQISFGDAALHEASRNIDFFPGTLFFLHMAHSYYIMALANCLKLTTMGLLTKPISKLRRMDNSTGIYLRLINDNLYLDIEPSPSLEALKRIHNIVSRKCHTKKPKGVAGRTQAHYKYSISSLEFEYREMVIQYMTRNRDYMNANFYLRFWAYCLLRCPVVLEEARMGKNPSFYIPYMALKKSIEETCPEIIDDLKIIFDYKYANKIQQSITGTVKFKQLVLDQIRGRDLL